MNREIFESQFIARLREKNTRCNLRENLFYSMSYSLNLFLKC